MGVYPWIGKLEIFVASFTAIANTNKSLSFDFYDNIKWIYNLLLGIHLLLRIHLFSMFVQCNEMRKDRWCLKGKYKMGKGGGLKWQLWNLIDWIFINVGDWKVTLKATKFDPDDLQYDGVVTVYLPYLEK